MQSRKKGGSTLQSVLTIILIINLIVLSFMFGVRHGASGEATGFTTTGCWRKVMTGQRSIAIKVDDRTIPMIMNTARHEICHEIHYRLNEDNFHNLSKDEKEGFAETCNPEEYLDA